MINQLIEKIERFFKLGIYQFTKEELSIMRRVNDYDRFMDASGQYDDYEDRQQRKSWSKEISKLRDQLTPKMKDFMNYTHWREWNNS